MGKAMTPAEGGEGTLRELARFFTRLGLTAFGGPAAHIAMMEQEAVRKRAWLTHEGFLDLLGACNLIPGPSSTQMAMSIGYQRAGVVGLVVGGFCFILPAVGLTLLIAWVYVHYGTLPQVQGLLYGVKPVVLAIVFHALWSLGKKAFRTRKLAALGLLALAASLVGLHPLLVLMGAGVFALTLQWLHEKRTMPAAGWAWMPFGMVAPAVSLGGLFLFFLKLGSVLFGSGYVLLAFLKADLVDRWHWLTQSQLLDAIAVGQVTPGPVFTTATFIGYVLKGWSGAMVATAGIFLPSFFFVAIVGRIVPRLRRSPSMASFLDGVNAGALALMASVTLALSRAALVDLWTALLGAACVVLLICYKPNPTWLVLGGGLVGFLNHGLAR